MKHLCIFLLLFIFSHTSLIYAQDRGCATHSILLEKEQNNPELKQARDKFEQQVQDYLLRKQQQRTSSADPDTTFVIPVVVHIIHNVPSGKITGNNISDEQVYSQIDILNQDFQHLNADTAQTPAEFKPFAADCKIQFCLASSDPSGKYTNGIVRTYYNKSSWGISGSEESLLKSLSYWPSDQYLNIWVCELGGNILGYAQLPGGYGLGGLDPVDLPAETDGVVIHYRAFGNIGNLMPPYNLGRTTTHEVGHWLGMRHIWGDIDVNAGDFCGSDYVNDTPWQQHAHNTTSTCSSSSLCQQSGGSAHTNMTCNYMDYSADYCMNMFTADQRDRMHAVMHLSPRRMALFHSKGCCFSGNIYAFPMQEDFNTPDAYLNKGWIRVSGDATEEWTNLQLGNGNGVMAINNIGFYDTLVSGSEIYYYHLITPSFFFNKAQSPELSFDLAYASNGSLISDSLVISYATSCDTIWTRLGTYYGNALLSCSRITTSFVPGDNEWKNVRVNLSSMPSLVAARFRFEDYSKQINTLYLDNINLYSNSPGFTLNLYPVPSDGPITAEVLYEGRRDLHWLIYNELGQKVLDEQQTQVYSHGHVLDLSQLPPALYIIRVISGEDIVQKKIILY